MLNAITSGLATKLKDISQLGQWSVTTEFAKSETQSKGVIYRIPPELSDQEILSECKQMGVTDARRLTYTRNGQTGKSLSVCLTFNTPNMPKKVQLGYEIFDVKPYIPPVIRCFNCQRLGHVASACRSKIRCVRCSGEHSYDQCTQKEAVKCSRCGGDHSSAYAGCNTYKAEKKIQEFRVTYNISYAEAAKSVHTNITVHTDKPKDTPSQISKPIKTCSEEKRTWTNPQTVQNNEQIKQNQATPINKTDASTQTDQPVGCQTEPTLQYLKADKSFLELLIGTLQIWESTKNKENKILEIQTLVEHLFDHTTETQKPKGKQRCGSMTVSKPNYKTRKSNKTYTIQTKKTHYRKYADRI